MIFEINYNGYFSKPPNIAYKQGKVEYIYDVDPDRLSLIEIHTILRKMKIDVYSTSVLWYRKSGKSLDDGLTIIEEDVDVYTMICEYKGLDVIQLYVEKGQDPLQVVSPKGKHLVPPRVPVSAKQALTWNDMKNISEEEMDCRDGMQDVGDEEMHNGDGDEGAADEDARDEEMDNRAWDEEDSDDPDYMDDGNVDSGSEDEDYESDEPSWETVKKRKRQPPSCDQEADGGWYSDPKDEDLHSEHNSLDEECEDKYPEFIEEVDMKKPQLKLGMKFATLQISRQHRFIVCARCLQKGHNQRSCKGPVHPKSKLFKPTRSNQQQPSSAATTTVTATATTTATATATATAYQPTRIGHTFEEFPSMTGKTSASQPTSYGRGMGEPVGGGRVMSRSALGDSFIRRGRGGGGSVKDTSQR
ncbi:unnamed protein product [Camellia sinensis]